MNAEEKILVVYFSHTGENYNVGYIEKGIQPSSPK